VSSACGTFVLGTALRFNPGLIANNLAASLAHVNSDCRHESSGHNTRKVARNVDSVYAELNVPLRVLRSRAFAAGDFSPSSYAEKPKAFHPFAEAILKSHGLIIVTPEYNGSVPGILKYFIDMLKFPESFEKRPVCFVGVSAGIWGALRPIEQLSRSSVIAMPSSIPNASFSRRSTICSTTPGKLNNPELLGRLKAQAEGYIKLSNASKR